MRVLRLWGIWKGAIDSQLAYGFVLTDCCLTLFPILEIYKNRAQQIYYIYIYIYAANISLFNNETALKLITHNFRMSRPHLCWYCKFYYSFACKSRTVSSIGNFLKICVCCQTIRSGIYWHICIFPTSQIPFYFAAHGCRMATNLYKSELGGIISE